MDVGATVRSADLPWERRAPTRSERSERREANPTSSAVILERCLSWLKEPLSKSGRPARASWVRIPPSPFYFAIALSAWLRSNGVVFERSSRGGRSTGGDKMTSQQWFRLEIKDIFGILGRGIVFEGTVLEGTASLGDKLEYFENDGTKILGIVKKILIKSNVKLFGIFSYSTAGKEIPNASQGQRISVLVWDLFNITKQCVFSPPLGEGHKYVSKISKRTLQAPTNL